MQGAGSTRLRPLVCAALLLAAGCRSAEPHVDLDRRQSATCSVFLPDGAAVQPECWLYAGDLSDDGNGQLLIHLGAPDAGPLAGGLVVPSDGAWDLRLKGPLHTGTFRFAALDGSTLALASLVGPVQTVDYALSPSYRMASWGDVELRLLRVDSQPAQIGPRLLSVVGGSVDLTFAALADPTMTMVARVSF